MITNANGNFLLNFLLRIRRTSSFDDRIAKNADDGKLVMGQGTTGSSTIIKSRTQHGCPYPACDAALVTNKEEKTMRNPGPMTGLSAVKGNVQNTHNEKNSHVKYAHAHTQRHMKETTS